jgi:phosphocarrier protein HPr
MLGAAKGDSVTISAHGDGAEKALNVLIELIEAKFGED